MKKILVISACLLCYASSVHGQVNTQIKKVGTNTSIQKPKANKAIIIPPASTSTTNKLPVPSRKRPVLTFAERLKRDMNSGKRPATFLAALLHSYERTMTGQQKSEFDLAVENALKRNPGASATLTQMLTAYKTIPVEIRVKSMPFDLASLNSKVGLSFADVRKLMAAAPGFRGLIDTSFFEKPKTLFGGDTSGGTESGGSYPLPFINSVRVNVENAEKKIYLYGSFTGNTPIVPIYFEPAQGQLLDAVNVQWINGKKVLVIWGKVSKERDAINSIIPAGLGPGKYNVSVMVPHSTKDEPVSNRYPVELSPYAYTFRMLTIKCIDESDPETFLGSNVSDEVRVAWNVFGGHGNAQFGMTDMYRNFDDGVEKTFILREFDFDDGGIFQKPPGAVAYFTPITAGIVTSHLFVDAMLFEMDQDFPDHEGDDCRKIHGDFLAELGMAGVDDLDIQLYQERLSQILDSYFRMCYHGSYDLVNEVRLSFSAGELQNLTNNEAGRHRGEMKFFNDDAMGSYIVTYEIRRYPL